MTRWQQDALSVFGVCGVACVVCVCVSVCLCVCVTVCLCVQCRTPRVCSLTRLVAASHQVTAAALKEMRLPGALAVGMPVAVGMVFRVVGYLTDRPLLGAEVLCSFLMMSTVTGILMALFLDNVGGAWVRRPASGCVCASVRGCGRCCQSHLLGGAKSPC